MASTNYTFQANLPAEAEVGDSFTTSMQVYDSLGVAQVFPVSWEKTGTNTWSMTVGTPTNTAGTATTGTLLSPSDTPYDITFNEDGTSTGGLWDIFPASDDEAIQGLTNGGDEIIFPEDESTPEA